MKSISVLLLCLGLSGCAITETRYDPTEASIVASQRLKLERDTKLNTWIGESEDSLIASWGEPVIIRSNNNEIYLRDIPRLKSALKEGKRVLMYAAWGKVIIGGPRIQTTRHSGRIGGASYSGTSSALVDEPFETIQTPATTYFLIDNSGKIESWEDNRMLIQQASYPPIKPSNKSASHSSSVSP